MSTRNLSSPRSVPGVQVTSFLSNSPEPPGILRLPCVPILDTEPEPWVGGWALLSAALGASHLAICPLATRPWLTLSCRMGMCTMEPWADWAEGGGMKLSQGAQQANAH